MGRISRKRAEVGTSLTAHTRKLPREGTPHCSMAVQQHSKVHIVSCCAALAPCQWGRQRHQTAPGTAAPQTGPGLTGHAPPDAKGEGKSAFEQVPQKQATLHQTTPNSAQHAHSKTPTRGPHGAPACAARPAASAPAAAVHAVPPRHSCALQDSAGEGGSRSDQRIHEQ